MAYPDVPLDVSIADSEAMWKVPCRRFRTSTQQNSRIYDTPDLTRLRGCRWLQW